MINTMNEKQKEAWSNYMEGLTYKEISDLTGVPLNTLKSWQKKFKWNRKFISTPGCQNTQDRVRNTPNITEKFKMIRGGLLDQLEKNGNSDQHFIDLVNDYMSMWTIKNKLIEDVKVRGVQVAYKNGERQFGTKKNDSVDSIIKYNAQMLNLLDKLGLKAELNGEDDDVEL